MELCLLGVGGADSIHPDYLNERLTYAQLADWLAFYRIRPFGTKRDDIRQALDTFWNVSVQLEKHPEDHSPKKYMLHFDDDPPDSEATSILKKIRATMAGETP
jgi:hypothetical protein